MADIYEAALRRQYVADETDHRRWLAEVTSRLSDHRGRSIERLLYRNRPNRPEELQEQGFYLCFQTSNRYGGTIYIMISRSRTDTHLTVNEIIDNLSSNEVEYPFKEFGEYRSGRRRDAEPGQYATIKFGPQWYLISKSGMKKPYYRHRPSAPSKNLNKFLTYKDFRLMAPKSKEQ
jgi:hypothetical protein